MNEMEKAMRERLAEVERLIDEAPRWGAYVAALGEEQRGLCRALGIPLNRADRKGRRPT